MFVNQKQNQSRIHDLAGGGAGRPHSRVQQRGGAAQLQTAMLGRLRQIRSHVSTAAAETGVQISAAFDGGNIEARPHSPFPTLPCPLPLCPLPSGWTGDLLTPAALSQVVDASDPSDIQLKFRPDVPTPQEGNREFYQCERFRRSSRLISAA